MSAGPAGEEALPPHADPKITTRASRPGAGPRSRGEFASPGCPFQQPASGSGDEGAEPQQQGAAPGGRLHDDSFRCMRRFPGTGGAGGLADRGAGRRAAGAEKKVGAGDGAGAHAGRERGMLDRERTKQEAAIRGTEGLRRPAAGEPHAARHLPRVPWVRWVALLMTGALRAVADPAAPVAQMHAERRPGRELERESGAHGAPEQSVDRHDSQHSRPRWQVAEPPHSAVTVTLAAALQPGLFFTATIDYDAQTLTG